MDATTTVGRGRCLTQVSQLLNLLDPRAVQRSGGLAVHGGLGCNLAEERGEWRPRLLRGWNWSRTSSHLSTFQRPNDRTTFLQFQRKFIAIY